MKMIYVSFSATDHSSNAVYISGLRENGVEVLDFFSKAKGFGKYKEAARFYLKNRAGVDFVMIGIHSSGLVPWMKLVSRKPIIYNALCSIIEREIVSRGRARKRSLKYLYWWLLDYIACLFSSFVMVETEHQVDYFKALFKV